MTGIDLGREYANIVCNKFGEMISILYGSTVFGVDSSDLDMSFIRDKDLTSNDMKLLKQMTIDYHMSNNLQLDDEVPYENKLIYTYDFLNQTMKDLPFPMVNNRFIIPKIIKSKEFLSSQEMKKRLILNILTVKHLIFNGNPNILKPYEQTAWKKMIDVIISYANLSEFTLDEIMNCFIKDPYNELDGEMYLGYKTNNINKIKYLCNSLQKYLIALTDEGVLGFREKEKYYIKKR